MDVLIFHICLYITSYERTWILLILLYFIVVLQVNLGPRSLGTKLYPYYLLTFDFESGSHEITQIVLKLETLMHQLSQLKLQAGATRFDWMFTSTCSLCKKYTHDLVFSKVVYRPILSASVTQILETQQSYCMATKSESDFSISLDDLNSY